MQALALKCEGNNGGSPSAHFGGTMRHILIRSIVVVLLVTSTRMALAAESGNPAYNWSGFYTGVNVGWNWVRTSNSGTAVTSAAVAPAPFLAPISQSFTGLPKSNSAIGGFQAGYNWQSPSNWIVGIEADFQAVGGGGTGTSQATTGGFFFPPVLTSEVQTVSHTDTLKWLGTVRGRLGYPILPSIMIYGTGGPRRRPRQRFQPQPPLRERRLLLVCLLLHRQAASSTRRKPKSDGRLAGASPARCRTRQ